MIFRWMAAILLLMLGFVIGAFVAKSRLEEEFLETRSKTVEAKLPSPPPVIIPTPEPPITKPLEPRRSIFEGVVSIFEETLTNRKELEIQSRRLQFWQNYTKKNDDCRNGYHAFLKHFDLEENLSAEMTYELLSDFLKADWREASRENLCFVLKEGLPLYLEYKETIREKEEAMLRDEEKGEDEERGLDSCGIVNARKATFFAEDNLITTLFDRFGEAEPLLKHRHDPRKMIDSEDESRYVEAPLPDEIDTGIGRKK